MEIYTYVVNASRSTWHTIQVGTYSGTSDDHAFDLTVSLLEAE